MKAEQFAKLLESALRELIRAADVLQKPTIPRTPMPRWRIFRFAPGVEWPGKSRSGRELDPERIMFGGSGESIYDGRCGVLGRSIAEVCRYQPRAVLRTLRRIQAATEWCRRRAEGRRRMAEEILRQQARALTILEAEQVLQGLGEERP